MNKQISVGDIMFSWRFMLLETISDREEHNTVMKFQSGNDYDYYI